LQPIRKIIMLMEHLQKGMAGINRFREVMAIQPEITDKEDAEVLSQVKGDITFSQVTFGYNQGKDVVKDLNFTIRAGETTALVGPSGAGKSTLVGLINRFYEADSGSIQIDGKDIRDVTQQSLRQHIGVVEQNVFLFNGTVAENIAYGKPEASPEEIIRAAKMANAHTFIQEMPQGYDSLIGERGIKLSGGQKQRLSIARMFLKDPPILILDEATSALDNETERIVQDSLNRLAKGRTALIIAHRLSTIQNADRILVLTENGIEESGTHPELLAKGGIYSKLYQSQFIPEENQA